MTGYNAVDFILVTIAVAATVLLVDVIRKG